MTILDKRSCYSCGAPLNVPESADFVTCNHCTTRLAVHHTETTRYTAQWESLAAGQDDLCERLRRMELETRLEQLDREWDQEQKDLLGTHRSDEHEVPTTGHDHRIVLHLIWVAGWPSALISSGNITVKRSVVTANAARE